MLDDRDGRPATQVFDHVLANRISQLRIRQFRSCPPVRPYKANVGGSIPSAPTNPIKLVLKNFTGVSPEQLLERMIELALYAEEKLKAGGS